MNFYYYILILIKHSIRNKTKEIPVGLAMLGKVGVFLTLPWVELVIFFISSCFMTIMVIGYSIENNYLSSWYGVNPIGIVLGVLLQFFMFDYYSRNYMTKFSLLFLKAVPFSNFKRYIYYLFAEVISLKLIIIPSALLSFLFFGLNKISILLNLTVTTIIIYIILCNVTLMIYVSVNTSVRWIAHGIPLVISYLIIAFHSSLFSKMHLIDVIKLQLILFCLLLLTTVLTYVIFNKSLYRRAFKN